MISNLTVAEENYIKAIYHLQQSGELVATNALADQMSTKPASVTDMIKKLKSKGWVEYEKYQGVQLSTLGMQEALRIIRKHRLWEFFLVEKLKFGWDEVHEVAEELEHINSEALIEKLDAYLGFPKFDPHGDPIPDSSGKMEVQLQMNLIDLPLDTKAVIKSVGSQKSELLELLSSKNMLMGSVVEVKQRYNFDHSMDVLVNGDPVHVSQQLAQALFVYPL